MSSFSSDEDKILPSKPVQLFTLGDNLFEELIDENHSGSSNKFALIPFWEVRWIDSIHSKGLLQNLTQISSENEIW